MGWKDVVKWPLAVAAAPVTGGASLAWPIVSTGIEVAGSLYGSHKAGQASDKALAFDRESFDAQMELERQRDAEKFRQWKADEEFRRREFDATEGQRLYDRSLSEYDQQLRMAQEARRGPYRQARRQAMGRLGDLLGIPFDLGQMVTSPTWSPPDGDGGAWAPLPDVESQTMGDLLGLTGKKAVPRGDATTASYTPVVERRRRPMERLRLEGRR